jgi:predicted nucleic acid-binding Zn ribbon protein
VAGPPFAFRGVGYCRKRDPLRHHTHTRGMASRDVTVRPSTGVLRLGDPQGPRRLADQEAQGAARALRERYRAKEYRARPASHGRPRRTAAPRRPRPTTRRRVAATRAGPDEPSESEPPRRRLTVTPSRTCCVCGASLDGRYANAVTCKGACRQKLYYWRQKRESQARRQLRPEERRWWQVRLAADPALRDELKAKVSARSHARAEREEELEREMAA